MTKLQKYLRKLPKQDYEDAIEYFNEYFSDTDKAGQQKLMEELGTPKQAAADLMYNLLDRKIQEQDVADEDSEKKQDKKGITLLAVLAILQIMPAHQDLRLRRLPDAQRLAHHAALERRTGHSLPFAGGHAPRQTVGQDGKQHPVGAQQMAGIEAVRLVHLPPHPAEITHIGVVIPDRQFRQVGPHPSLHKSQPSFLYSFCILRSIRLV